MADQSAIEWTDTTWNPVTGCDRVSPGCANCYALTLAARLKRMGLAQYQVDGDPKTSGPGFGVTLHPHILDKPLRWRKPRRVFVNSMSDLFHEAIPDEYVQRVFAVMAASPQHTFQVLTKRPKRMRDLVAEMGRNADISEHVAPGLVPMPWPLPNVWLGVSIENRRFVDRADLLRQTPAAVRFISAEPLLGPLLPDADYMVDYEHETYPIGDAPVYAWRPWADGYDGPGINLEEIDWLIVGGESGQGHRPVKPQWVQDLRDYTQEECWQGEREGVTRFFFKQWGGPKPTSGGRELDGRTWDEYPEIAAT
jgi:protein gp37